MSTHSSIYAFIKASSIGIVFTNTLILSVGYPFSHVIKCWCAPVPPGFLKLLSDTVTTFAVFPSWLNLLGGDDDCMLSVPSGTCELHISCWQGSDSCQAIAAEVLTLFNYALWFLLKADDPFFFVLSCCLPKRVSCSTIPVFSA